MPTHANHYITKDFDKFHVESLVLRVQESHRDQVLFRASEDWEKQLSSDITNDLVTSLKVHHLTMKADGSVVKDLYDLKNHGKYYSLYNKKYKVRLGVYDGNEIRSGKIAQNSWDRSAVLLVEDPLTYNYSIVTLPLVAWKNSSGQFLTLTNDQHGDLSFTNGETTHEGVAPKSEQLFMFVPHPGNICFC
ncbi:6996_t:CDS:2 [Entrophospora sp. SA101]